MNTTVSTLETELVLGIETSCDETSASVVVGGKEVLSCVVSSQIDLHARFGGVVPEVASRAHIEALPYVIEQALQEAGISMTNEHLAEGSNRISGTDSPHEGKKIGAIAVTQGPGLVGALLVGVSTAKALGVAWDVPCIAVNHLEGHLHAAFLEQTDLEFPLIVLLVSGGHTLLVLMRGYGDYEIIGSTIDDAAGEAFDKVARYLELPYPGGPVIDRLAKDGNGKAVAFPRAMRNEGFDFSFSGLKTSVIHYVQAHPETSVSDIAASFQDAVVDVLVQKTLRAVETFGAKGICLAGGVAANSGLRTAMKQQGDERNIPVFLPSPTFCTDNAAMIAAAGWYRWKTFGASASDFGAVPNLRLTTP